MQVKPALVTAVTALLALNAGCATEANRNPVPMHLMPEASVPGMGPVRYWGDEMPKEAVEELRRKIPYMPRLAESPPEHGKPVVNFLAISSGGDDGAFAAGLLVGWTQSGRRPRFEIVTGVSAGALIAPLAFLGPAYDRQLTAMWTRYGTQDLIVKRPLAAMFGGAALADTGPLAELIAYYIDQPFLDAVAAEYRRGRILLIETTNLDAQRPVVWNMTAIAGSRHPRALSLFRQVLLASASVPGIFPPVHIRVEAGGELREEMHVDGGTTQKVFIAPLQLRLSMLDPLYSAPPLRRIYVISNTKLAPEWEPPRNDTRAIAERSLRTLSKSQGAGDLIRLYVLATRDGAEFNLAAIPSSFRPKSKEAFDRHYMRALFDVGFVEGRGGYRWLSAPPELGATEESDGSDR
jgi:predicted acylesterase/phospholipase RssA